MGGEWGVEGGKMEKETREGEAREGEGGEGQTEWRERKRGGKGNCVAKPVAYSHRAS